VGDRRELFYVGRHRLFLVGGRLFLEDGRHRLSLVGGRLFLEDGRHRLSLEHGMVVDDMEGGMVVDGKEDDKVGDDMVEDDMVEDDMVADDRDEDVDVGEGVGVFSKVLLRRHQIRTLKKGRRSEQG